MNKRKQKSRDAFTQWSKVWKAARDSDSTTIEQVLKICDEPFQVAWQREDWSLAPGFRKSHKEGGSDVGEQIIEKDLLGGTITTIGIHQIQKGKEKYPLVAFYNNCPLACIRNGQVIADAFGVFVKGKQVHPLAIEVKDTADDLWSVLVQNLQQVKMARSSEKKIHQFLSKHHMPPSKGTWGLVLAPKDYYGHKKNVAQEKKCEALLKALKATELRIAFGRSDYLKTHRIPIIMSNWD